MKESEYYGVLFSTSSTSKVPGKSWGRLVQVQKIESLVEEEKRKASLGKKKKGRLFPWFAANWEDTKKNEVGYIYRNFLYSDKGCLKGGIFVEQMFMMNLFIHKTLTIM
jgi:hypothetical protein